MNRFDLFRSIGEVDEALLARSDNPDRRKMRRSPLLIAASFALCIGILGVAMLFRASEKQTAPYFFLSAYAENGELNTLVPNSFYSNSEEPQTNPFGIDFPLFGFTLNTSDSAKYPLESVRVAIFYNGKEMQENDPHLMLTYQASVPWEESRLTRHICGWFEEPTDLTIRFFDRETDELIEEILLHIRYVAETQNYRLTIRDTQSASSVSK